MHLKFLFNALPLLTAATALADGYTVPKDIAPGFYVVNFHEDGNTTTEKVDIDTVPHTVNSPEKRSLLDTGSSKFARQLTKRGLTLGSTGRYMTQQAQYNSLTQNWKDYFGGFGTISGPHIWFFTSSDLVLALCLYNTVDNWSLPPSAVDDFNRYLDLNIGYWQTGWANTDGAFTFWRDYRGHQICGNLNGGWVPK